MQYRKKFTSILLALALLLSTAACGGNRARTEESEVYEADASETETAETEAGELAASAGDGGTYGQLSPELAEGEAIRFAQAQGGRIYFVARQEDGEENAVYDSVYVMEADGGGQGLITAETAAPAGEEGLYSVGIRSFCACEDGSVWYLLVSEGVSRMIHRDGGGSELASVETDYDTLSFLLPAGDGGAVLFGETVTVLDSGGDTLFAITPDGGYYEDAALLEDGTVAAQYFDIFSGAICLQTLDMDAGAFVTRWEMTTTKNTRVAGGTADALWLWGGAVYLWEPESDTLTTKLDWAEAGLSSADVSGVYVLSGERLFIVKQAMDDGESLALYVLPAGYSMQDGEKTTLRLAGVSLPYELTEAVLAFNRESDAYYIEIEDYFNYNTSDDYTAGAQRLLYEINTGELPDMVYFGSDLSAEDMAEKGYLADIGALLDGSGAISRDELLENVLEAAEIDGTLRTLPLCFVVETAAGRADVVGGSACTVENVLAWIEENPDVAEVYAEMWPSLVLQRMIAASGDALVDREAGVCRFDSEEFSGILELCAMLSTPAYDDAYYTALEAGSFLFVPIEAMGLWEIVAVAYDAWDGADYVFTGYPHETGSGAFFRAGIEVGIAADTASVEGCWAFMEYLLSAECQELLWYDGAGIPLRADMLEEQKQELLSSGVFDGESIEEAAALCQADLAFYRGSSVLGDIISIALEEAETYFSGGDTLENTIGRIQSRASILMSERS